MKTIYFEGKIGKIVMIKALSKFSKKAYHLGVSPIRYKKLADPKELPETWCKVKNVQSGICGSDMTFYKCMQSPGTAFLPMPCSDITYLGHETVGVVDEVGKKVKDLKAGDRVIMKKYMACCDLKGITTPCKNCKEGNYAICENYGEPSNLNFSLGAGFGDYYFAPQTQLIKIDDAITDDEAVLVEPLSVSLHSVMKKIPEPNDKVLVVGAGMIGLNVIQFARLLQPKCKIYVLEKNKNKHEIAKRLGADEILSGDPYKEVARVTGAKLYEKGKNRMLIGGFDIIYDSVGKGKLLTDTLRWLRAQGTLVKVGYQMNTTKFDETPIWWQGLNIIGVDSHGMENYNGEKISSFDLVLRFLKEKKLDLSGFITQRYKVKDYKKAFKLLIENPSDTIKVVLENKED